MTLATRQGTMSNPDDGLWVFSVTGLDGDDESSHFSLPSQAFAVSIQALGTFSGGGTLSVQASNDNTTFADLPTDTAFSAVGIKSLATADLAYRYYRLLCESGDGSHSVGASVVIRTRR